MSYHIEAAWGSRRMSVQADSWYVAELRAEAFREQGATVTITTTGALA